MDRVIESAKCGNRKPDPEIFKLACRQLNVKPSEVVFLDDIGTNLKAAKLLGNCYTLYIHILYSLFIIIIINYY